MQLECLGTRIAYCRKMRGYSQSYVAEKSSMDQSYYSKIERGLHIPSVKTLYSIACVLGSSVDYLLGRVITSGDFPVTKYHECLISLCDVCMFRTLGLNCPAPDIECTYYSDNKIRSCSAFVLNRKFLNVDVPDGYEEDK